MDSAAKVDPVELKAFEDDLEKMSSTFKELYDLIETYLMTVHEKWQDSKFDEFTDVFRKDQEKVAELAEKYHTWSLYVHERREVIEKTNPIAF